MSNLCDYGCGQEAKYEMGNGKLCCSEHFNSCPAIRTKVSEGVKRAFEEGKKDTEHLNGHRGWSKGKTFDIGENGKKLIKDTAKKDSIKSKLIEKRGHKCEGCSQETWREESIPLEIHRIDETKTYKESGEENFKLLCPNCHAQTDNYRNKNGSPSGSKKATDEELAEAIKEEDSLRQALLSVGLAGKGANYERAKRIEEKIC